MLGEDAVKRVQRVWLFSTALALLPNLLWNVISAPFRLWGYSFVWLYEVLSIEGETVEWVILWPGLAQNILLALLVGAIVGAGFMIVDTRKKSSK